MLQTKNKFYLGMKHSLHAYFVLVTLMFFWGCKGPISQRNQFGITIRGQIESGQNIALFFDELTPTTVLPIDSIFTDENGKFTFDLFVEETSFYRLGIGYDNFITLSIEPGEIVEIYANAEDMLGTYIVEGSSGSEILWQLNQNRILGMKKIDSLRTKFDKGIYNNNLGQIRDELIEAYHKVLNRQKEKALEIIDKNPSNLASILVLYYNFDNNRLINENESLEYFRKLSKTLCNAYPANKHVMDLKKRINEYSQAKAQQLEIENSLAIGNLAPEITLPDQNGQIVALSSLRGNVVLINFWAAWCPPCRNANPLLVDIYSENKDRGFEVFAVSLDRTRDQWIRAIKDDNLTWTNVSDLRFMNSPVVALYNVQNIPHNVLLDRSGRIVGKNLTHNELKSRLEALL